MPAPTRHRRERLVLNKTFAAIAHHLRPSSVLPALQGSGQVVSLDEGQYNAYDFASWSELSAYRASHFRKEKTTGADSDSGDSGPAGHPTPGLRQAAQANGGSTAGTSSPGTTTSASAEEVPDERLSLDHVIPRSQGGGTIWMHRLRVCGLQRGAGGPRAGRR